MDDRRRRALRDYVSVLQVRLRLQDWTIVISDVVAPDDPDEVTLAQITPTRANGTRRSSAAAPSCP